MAVAPIEVGAVYFEDSVGADEGGDVFEVTWIGGVPGTQLTQLMIDTDKLRTGSLDPIDTFFDVEPGGKGVSGYAPLLILDQTGIDPIDISLDTSVADGGMMLVMNFTGFDPGERLIFSIDVDEEGLFNPTALAEGGEFEGSFLIAKFAVDHFHEASGEAIFWDVYADDPIVTRLGLPPDSYITSVIEEEVSHRDQTAGAYFAVTQEPLPISIAGSVYEDINLDNRPDPGEPGLPGVGLALLAWEVDQYVATGQTTVTDTAGDYRFEDVLPGEYQIVETQPTGYLSIGATAGTVNGVTRGVVSTSNVIGQITLVGGEESVDNDFAEAVAAELSGYVYHDADNDGFFDSSETGIAGAEVRVQYLPPSGPPPSAIVVQTGSDGSWSAADLHPGDYRIEETTPPGYLDGLDSAGTAGGTAQNPGDSVTGIRLESGQSGRQYNFGELVPSSIGGRVIGDTDADCLYDASDLLLEDVVVHLRDAEGNLLDSTRTDALGLYSFTGLAPGIYGVEEIQPDGYFDSGDHVGSAGGVLLWPDSIIDVTLVSATTATGYDFCELLPSSISGRVIADADGDGAIDPGETPISGVTVYLLNASGNRIETDVTGADGTYAFTGLAPGEYGVEEITPDGYFDGADLVGSEGGQLVPPDSISSIRLISGTDATRYDFLELLPSGISGRVIADADGDGAIDPSETPISGVTVYLLDASGNRIETDVTGADGTYAFTGLAPGEYGVEETTPDGYFDGADLVGSEGGQLVPPDTISSIRLISGTDATYYDFLELLPSSISGRVIADANGNCLYDPGEALLEGVTVYLLGASGNRIESTVTDSTGRYAFTGLAPGEYGVEEIQPDGYFDGDDHVGSAGGLLLPPDSIDAIRLISGTAAVGYDFCELLPVSLSGYVYADDNDNGRRDSGEAGIAGVGLSLLDAPGEAAGITARTDSSGFYRFDGLRPNETYGVVETQPAGFFDGTDSAGTAGGVAQNPGDSIWGAFLPTGTAGEDYNFGELRPASIGGRVHAERNGDCVPDPDEPLLAGVTVYLLDTSGNRIESTVTDANGEYRFVGLKPGRYGVEEIQPEGYYQWRTHVGSAGGELVAVDRIEQAELDPGVEGTDYNFCESLPASISGYVFQDGPTIRYQQGEPAPDPMEVRDGKFTSDDAPIAGVVLTLGDGSGAPVETASGIPITTVTDENGFYEFTGLEHGVYTVLETQPDGFTDSIDTAGSHGGIAVNPNEELDAMLLSQLAIDPHDDAILRIPIGMGDEAVEYNFSEVRLEEFRQIIPPWRPPPDEPPPLPPPRMPHFAQPGASPAMYVPGQDLPAAFPLWGGGGQLPMQSWHLSVINGGRPRSESGGVEAFVGRDVAIFNPDSWTGPSLDRAEWIMEDPEGNRVFQFLFGLADGIPLTGDFDGDGSDEAAVFVDGIWFLDLNGNGIWDSDDLWAELGSAGDLPVTGDWDGDGKTDIGIFGIAWFGDSRAIQAEPGLPDAANRIAGGYKNLPPSQRDATSGVRTMKRTTEGPLRSDLIDHVFQYGSTDDLPVTGDFNGDGVTNIGLYRGGTWYLDLDANGRWSSGDVYVENFGSADDLPVVGDFNGDGVDQLGIYRDGTWRLDTNGNRRLDDGDEVRHLGTPGDLPVVGDFDGDGVDEIGVYRAQQAGMQADAAVTGADHAP